jgi:hypothetical protein
MSIEEEFATIDALLASNAETRGVDAFALALLKAERQMWKLVTYLCSNLGRSAPTMWKPCNALAARRVYFRDFLSARDKLYRRPMRDLLGPDHDRLRAVLDETIEHRNKIFHWQLTTKHLSRDELIAYVAQIRCWCRTLAASAQEEVGHDGFGRNSFRKSADAGLASRLLVAMTSVQDYERFLAEMERRPNRLERMLAK